VTDGTVVVVKSTVAPGTSDALAEEYPNLDFAIIPEFLVARAPMKTFTNPDRVVIGARSEATHRLLASMMVLVAPNAPVIAVSPVEAELIKLCSNAKLAAKVALANELAPICEGFGVDWNIRHGIGADRRIGMSHIELTPERGYGGGCLPNDVDGLIAAAGRGQLAPSLLERVAESNRMGRPRAAREGVPAE